MGEFYDDLLINYQIKCAKMFQQVLNMNRCNRIGDSESKDNVQKGHSRVWNQDILILGVRAKHIELNLEMGPILAKSKNGIVGIIEGLEF